MSRKNNGQYQFKVFDREKFMHPENPYKSKLSTYQHLITDVALLLGNDYCPRIHGNGVVKVVSGENSMAFVLYLTITLMYIRRQGSICSMRQFLRAILCPVK